MYYLFSFLMELKVSCKSSTDGFLGSKNVRIRCNLGLKKS